MRKASFLLIVLALVINLKAAGQCTPSLTVSGSINYCSHTCSLIAPALTISGACSTGINGAKVYFSSGYVAGQDSLWFTPQNGISGWFNQSTGVLTLSGAATIAQYQQALQSLCYKNYGGVITPGARVVTIVIGDAIYNSGNGHYYKLVNNGGNIDWMTARAAAAATNYFGQQGYLVTVTSAQENTFLMTLIQSNAWMGASDSAQEGVWRWVTGCEGLENNGYGRYFSDQHKLGQFSASTGTSVNGYYANWYADNTSGEPNDWSCAAPGGHCEDYAHFRYAPGFQDGTWNDLPNSGGQVSAYIIEYGCMPGDPMLNIQGSVIVNVGSPVYHTQYANICASALPYIWNGQSVTAGGAAAATFITPNSLGCDSNVTLNLTVKPVSANTQSLTKCTTDLPFIWNGIAIPATATTNAAYTTFTTTNSSGCDSIVTLSLTVKQATGSTQALSKCASALPSSWNGITIPAGTVSNAAFTTYHTLNAAGCDSAVTLNLTVLPNPVLAVLPLNPTICAGASITLSAGGAVTYSWSPAAGLSATMGVSVMASPTATTVYTITGTNAAGCISTLTDSVIVKPLPIATAMSNAPVCTGAMLSLTGSSSLPGAAFSWSGTGGFSSAQQSFSIPQATVSNGGQYVLTVILNGCSSKPDTTSVLVRPLPILAVNPALAAGCKGSPMSLSARGAQTYSWMPAGGGSTTGATYQSTISVSTSVKLRGTDAFGCTDSMIIPITAYQPALTSLEVRLCHDTMIQFGATTITTIGTYYDTLQTSHGCDSVMTLRVLPPPGLYAAVVAPDSACVGEPVQTTGVNSAGQQFLWNFSGGHVISGTGKGPLIVSWAQPGAYAISISASGNGCATTRYDTIIINLVPEPKIVMNQPRPFCSGDTIAVHTAEVPFHQYAWSPGGYMKDATAAATEVYHYTGYPIVLREVNEHGCAVSDTAVAPVAACCNVVFPDAFSPNGDGRNDVFRPVTMGFHSPVEFRVMDRWGRVVYSSAQEQKGWDGTSAGQNCEMGVYFYLLNYYCEGKTVQVKGEVSLVR